MTPARIIELRDILADCKLVHRAWAPRYASVTHVKCGAADGWRIMRAHEERSARRINRYRRLLSKHS